MRPVSVNAECCLAGRRRQQRNPASLSGLEFLVFFFWWTGFCDIRSLQVIKLKQSHIYFWILSHWGPFSNQCGFPAAARSDVAGGFCLQKHLHFSFTPRTLPVRAALFLPTCRDSYAPRAACCSPCAGPHPPDLADSSRSIDQLILACMSAHASEDALNLRRRHTAQVKCCSLCCPSVCRCFQMLKCWDVNASVGFIK